MTAPVISPNFIDHLVFRTALLERIEIFYTALLGSPADRSEEHVMYLVGETRLFFTPADSSRCCGKEEVGLNHLAFGVRTMQELQCVGSQLDTSGISHSGIMVDSYGNKEFIWLDDPDGRRLEFYLRLKVESQN